MLKPACAHAYRPHCRPRSLLLVLLFALLAAGPVRGAIFDPHAVRAEVLPNGLRVIVHEDAAAQVVAIEVVVRAGVADEPAGHEGLAHLLEHTLWSSAEGSDPRAEIEQTGGTTNAGTGRDWIRFYATVPADQWRTGLRALVRMAFQNTFDSAAVEREKQAIVSEVGARADQPQSVLLDLAFQSVYGPDHPYGRRLEGNQDSLLKLTRIDLVNFHRTWFAPNNTAVVVGGPVKTAEVVAAVTSLVGGTGPRPVPSRHWPEVPRPRPGREVQSEIGGDEAYVMAAFVGPAITEPADVAATDVLLALLTDPTFGRLRKSLQGADLLADGLGIEFLTQRDRALFGVWAACKPEKVAAVKETIRQELTRLAAEKVSPQDLATAKRLASAGYVFSNETPADRVSTLGFYDALGVYREAGQYLTRIDSATDKDLQRVAGWYSQDPVWVVLLPKEGGQ
jgi:zinc protease